MKKVILSRFGAYGDHIHCSHLPRLLKEKAGFDHVAFQYNLKGMAIHKNNPFIDEHIVFDPSLPVICDYPKSFVDKRLHYFAETQGFEKVIDLQNSIERGYIAMEDQNEYYLSTKERREKYGELNYYDQTTLFAGYPEHLGAVGEIFFTTQEEEIARSIFERSYKDKFVIVANLSGSSKHKLFYGAEGIIKEFLKRHEDAICITLGDEDCKENIEFQGERIVNRCGTFDQGRYPFRQSMIIAKYANAVVGCESGLMVVSTLFGTPTIQLMTAASIKNHGGDFPNDYSLQSPVACSPCHKGPYHYVGCPTFDHLGLKYPVCIKFDSEIILNRLEEVYDHSRIRAAS